MPFSFFFSIPGPVDHITTAMSQSHLDDDDDKSGREGMKEEGRFAKTELAYFAKIAIKFEGTKQQICGIFF